MATGAGTTTKVFQIEEWARYKKDVAEPEDAYQWRLS